METYRYFSVYAIVAIWVFSGLVLLKWFKSKSLSLSLHAAGFRKAYLLLASGLTLNAVFFYFFALNWLTPSFSLPVSFIQICTLALFFQLIAAWVPDIKGKFFSKLHNFSAYTLAMCMPIILLFLINSPKVSIAAKTVAIVACIVMVVELAVLLFINRKNKHHLIYQVIYASVFHITLLIITFFG